MVDHISLLKELVCVSKLIPIKMSLLTELKLFLSLM